MDLDAWMVWPMANAKSDSNVQSSELFYTWRPYKLQEKYGIERRYSYNIASYLATQLIASYTFFQCLKYISQNFVGPPALAMGHSYHPAGPGGGRG